MQYNVDAMIRFINLCTFQSCIHHCFSIESITFTHTMTNKLKHLHIIYHIPNHYSSKSLSLFCSHKYVHITILSISIIISIYHVSMHIILVNSYSINTYQCDSIISRSMSCFLYKSLCSFNIPPAYNSI